MTDEKVREFSELCALSCEKGTLKNFVLSSSNGLEIQKIKGTVKSFSKKNVVQLEYFLTEGRVKQENIEIPEIANALVDKCLLFSRCDLNDSAGSAALMRSKKGKVSIVKHGNIGQGEVVKHQGDKVKNYILCGWRYADAALRFKYSGVEKDKTCMFSDMKEAVSKAVSGDCDTIYVLANYSALFEIKELFK